MAIPLNKKRRVHASDYRMYQFECSINKVKPIPLRIPNALREHLEQEAKRNNMSLNSLLHAMIEEGLTSTGGQSVDHD